ncbi:CASP-like protein 1B2 [Chenopodium quinoa]|uniref:CASP-like protein n=1 Tax=Chenopodium quinoa TaxID=63459 RepID=A0A803MIM4_CHEQI|nr:CASP-like protein 1B2 [Chenopodium quinoa]XP_021763824.1 CASP-like protein 1B2 [Chenopodium quinoa]
MAQLSLQKSETGYNSLQSLVQGSNDMVVALLRLVALLATLAATIVMALNKETKTFVVATIGTNTIKATLTARFQDTPANTFFVVANGLATLHNLLVLAAMFFGKKIDSKGARYVVISFLDIINLAILSAGTNSAVFMAQLARHGNNHAQWNKVCDKFDTFCSRGGGAILASYVGLAIFLIVILISAFKLHQTVDKNNNNTHASVEM